MNFNAESNGTAPIVSSYKVISVPQEHQQWDFSIANGCIVSLLLAYTVRIATIRFEPLETRNKLTLTIFWSHYLNILTLEIKKCVFVTFQMTINVSQLLQYAISSIACFFYVNAVMLQCFEWDLLASMIQFQSRYKVSELNVLREDFNKTETKKVRVTGYIIWLNIFFFMAKVLVPCITLITCSVQNDESNCNKLAN